MTIQASHAWYDEHQLYGKSQYAIGKASRLEQDHQNVYGTPWLGLSRHSPQV